MSKFNNYLAIDVGEKRIGLAVANSVARLPRPLAVIPNDYAIYDRIQEVINKENINTVIVGLPRNMSGKETAQSEFSRQFAAELEKTTGFKIEFADESLSTVKAKESNYKRDSSGYLDSISACFILEEYLEVGS